MTLYHAHSDVLRGFYQSDVFVSAKDDESAVWKAVTAYRHEIQRNLKNWSLYDVNGNWIDPDDADAETRVQGLVEAFTQEMAKRLAPVAGGAAIMVRS